jgi:hypothetical protein
MRIRIEEDFLFALENQVHFITKNLFTMTMNR